jgi:hypothetical protein
MNNDTASIARITLFIVLTATVAARGSTADPGTSADVRSTASVQTAQLEDDASIEVPSALLKACRKHAAGDPCSVALPRKLSGGGSFAGICTALPIVGRLICLQNQPAPSCAVCGDGRVTGGEQCDPGPAGSTAECNANCTVSACGDGIVNQLAGEQCDTGGVSTAWCNANCTVARCGDGIVNPAAGEACDTGGATPWCNANCTISACGDGIVNQLAGEQCDAGGMPTAWCNANCTVARCGDGIVNSAAGEACDTGGATPTCNADCTLP